MAIPYPNIPAETPETAGQYVDKINANFEKINSSTTDDIPEGSKEYFTDERAKAALNFHVSDNDIHVTPSDKSAWSAKQPALTFDSTPTANSANPVTSGGVKTALDAKLDKTSVVNDLTTGGTTSALSAEQGKKIWNDVDFPAINLVTNGDFSNGATGWSAMYCALSVSNNILTATGDGANSGLSTYALTTIPSVEGKKVFMRARVKVTNEVCDNIVLLATPNISGSSVTVAYKATPSKDAEYFLTGILTVPSGWSGDLRFRVQSSYADAATANGKVMKVQCALAIDLTSAFGSGNEPTAAQMDALLSFYPNSWFDGTVNLAANQEFVPYLLSSIQQLNTEKTGYGVYSGLAVTAQSTPNMTVNVSAGVIYMDTGRRFTPVANTALSINAADATNPRIDIVYVDSSGVIAYLAGTAATSASAPSVPSGGQKLAEISVEAGAASITSIVITDRRRLHFTDPWYTPTLLGGWIGDATNPPRYMKTADNFVFWGGRVSGGAPSTALTSMPTGYRLGSGKALAIICSSDTASGIRVSMSAADIYINTATTTYVDLAAFHYRAEA